jgi:hypothetical protein
MALLPMVVLSGELPGTIRLLTGPEASTFFWGATITVSRVVSEHRKRDCAVQGLIPPGHLWLSDQLRCVLLHQSHLPGHPQCVQIRRSLARSPTHTLSLLGLIAADAIPQ